MTLPRLTALRWWAALAVFVRHIGPEVAPSSWWAGFGQAGVAFFFALSGVVLAWSTPEQQRPSEFYRRRFARIYPATLASGVAAAVLVGVGVTGLRAGFVGAITNGTLTQAWFPDPSYPVLAYNGVSWSLSCEMFFYLCFPWLLSAARRWTGRSLRVAVVSTVVLTFSIDMALHFAGAGGSAPYNMPILRLSEFIVGVAVGLKLRSGWIPTIGLGTSSFLLVELVFIAQWTSAPAFAIFMLPGTVAVICSAAARDIKQRPGWLTRRTFVYLGELSFSFYLVHWLALRVLLSAGLRDWWLLAALVPSALAAALLLHHGVELPAQRWINRRGKPDRRYLSGAPVEAVAHA